MEFCEIDFALVMVVLMQAAQKFAHVTTVKQSWHVQNSDRIGSLLFT